MKSILPFLALHAAPLSLSPVLPFTSGYQLEDAFGGKLDFNQPLAIVSASGLKNQLFVIEKKGRIIAIDGYTEHPHRMDQLDAGKVITFRV